MIARHIPTVAAALALMGASSAHAAEAWTLHEAVGAPAALKLSGSIRLRYEALDGQFRPGAKTTDSLLVTRSQLFAEYDTGPLRFGAELFDGRGYGARAGGALTTGEVNTAEFVQAYVAADFKDPFGPGTSVSVQAGRFVLALGSRRLVANEEYRNTTNGFTGLKLDAKATDGAYLTVIATMPQVRLPDDTPSLLDNETAYDKESRDLLFWGAVAGKPGLWPGVDADLSYFGLDEEDAPGRPTRNRSLRTLDAHLIRNPKPGHWDYEAEGAYQYGRIAASTAAGAADLDVSAAFVRLSLAYQFTDSWKTRVIGTFDYAGGDDSDASYGRFDTLYGTRRNDFGPTGIYGAVGRVNVVSPSLRVEVAPTARLDAMAAYRELWLESATDSALGTGIRDATGRSGDHAGGQLEARVRYWLVPKSLRLEANGAILFKAGPLERAPNAPRTGDTRYGSVALTASF